MQNATDFDGAWKEMLERFWQPFLELCFPGVAAKIDWRVAPEFLDQELQEVVRDADLGKQRVDKLARVRLLDGRDQWLFIHIEVQSQRDPHLEQRVYQYHHRLVDRLGKLVLTLVVLGDMDPNWCPRVYQEEVFGCRLRFEYPVCKVVELPGRVPGWEQSTNPAAVVIAAHLAAQGSTKDMGYRKRVKWELTRRLHERGFGRQDVLELFRLIDWLLRLPEELELAFRTEVVQYETEKVMPYITSIERIGREEGRREGWQAGLQEGRQEGWQEGRQEAIMEALEARFGVIPPGLRQKIVGLRDAGRLQQAFRQAVLASSLERFEAELSTGVLVTCLDCLAASHRTISPDW